MACKDARYIIYNMVKRSCIKVNMYIGTITVKGGFKKWFFNEILYLLYTLFIKKVTLFFK